MIIIKQKSLDEILSYFQPDDRIFIVGCSECATMCQAGGEEEVKSMTKYLKERGFTVTGSFIAEPACNRLEVIKQLRRNKEALRSSTAILVLACGDGVQTIGGETEIPVYPGCDTLFLGELIRHGEFEERCRLCGECILEETGAICPLTRCSKGLLNGPCGGYTEDGKCEVNPEQDCAWILIYKRLEEQGRLDKFKEIKSPKKRSASSHPGKLSLKRWVKGYEAE